MVPWIGRLYATGVDLPENYTLQSGLFSDVSCIRIQLRGDWTAQTADGPRQHARAALLFGPNTRVMPVTVTGSFLSVGIMLRPGSGHALRGMDTSQLVDRFIFCDALGIDTDAGMRQLEACDSPEAMLSALEDIFADCVKMHGGGEPDPVSTAFEYLSFTDPQASVADFAKDMGISQRQLERIIRRDFGLPPKQMLRRARALDMASHLRGVADAAEAEDLILRYYDQAQMTREFAELFGTTPRRFVATANPILTLALESRQARRLEAIARIAPGAQRPWQ
nr:helix-turn-helix domain-containing protein [Novosphingobium ovatum]